MKKVLFVDDEPLIAQGLSSILNWSKYGIEIAGTANDGLSALEMIREETVDLLVTDIMMPRMNGLELIRKIKEAGLKIKFVVLSGYEEFEYVKAGITLGIENYILKPINLEELEFTIRHIRGDWDREELQQVHFEEDWEVLRSNILQRWVSGEIESQEFKHRAELLGLPLNCGLYQLFVVRPIPGGYQDAPESFRNEMGEKCRELAKAVEQSKPAETEVISFMDPDGDLVILYAFRGQRDVSAAQRQLLLAAEDVQNGSEGSFWISEGGAGCDSKGVQNSYGLAKAVFHRYLISGEERIRFTALTKPEDIELPSMEWDNDHYVELLIEGRIEAVEPFIEQVLRSASREHLTPRESCVNTGLQLMLAVKEREDNPDYSEVFAPIGRISTLPALVRHVTSVVRRSLEKQETGREDFSPHVAFLVEQVHRHYAEELSLKTLSQKAGLHPNYLGQLFQQEVGNSFSDYVNQYRIEKATQLLINTDRKTTEIALGVGYLDTSYFYRQFKKYAGVSPTELRHMYNK
ncbi:two-component system response regulator YesN [Fontibacillus phaseoli]|uniref:Two-component system response regulator YesN n=1 Tax=Fontibacillus phaseoli TaxID=1416533 RepID=A0A369BCL3_9BACL|nr:response regulator transcription factor [Fontibacillus phaseoli]RCX18187.1 two-component system response regulator YesN [Fontibacillus phaseoli]